jgi:hypothetical protein
LVEDANMIHSIKTTFAAAVLATTFGASAAMAGTIMIDDFMVGGGVQAEGLNGAGPVQATVTGPLTSILGGVRFMQVRTDQGSDTGTSLSVTQNSGILRFANDSASTGSGWLVYDGNTTIDRMDATLSIADVNGVALEAVVDTAGLGSIDFLQGQLDGFFEFDVKNFDNDFGNLPVGTLTFSAFAWDASGGAVSYFEAIDPMNFSPLLAYSQFTGTPFDWSEVSALAFRIDTNNIVALDGELGAITATPIPLPASVLLLLGGVGGLAGLSAAAKRRRKA